MNFFHPLTYRGSSLVITISPLSSPQGNPAPAHMIANRRPGAKGQVMGVFPVPGAKVGDRSDFYRVLHADKSVAVYAVTELTPDPVAAVLTASDTGITLKPSPRSN